MKTIIKSLILSLTFLSIFSANNANAQVTVSGSLGTANGTYSTLRNAFIALNMVENQFLANITITINAAGYQPGSETGSCMLDQPSVSNWASLLIKPVGTVIVSTTAGFSNPLIDLNGADKVTIDGINSGIDKLEISSSFPARNTIRFSSDATNNIITNCTVLGSDLNYGTIYFAGSALTSGNDDNIISNCDIGPAGSLLPENAIYSEGTTNNETRYNSGNTITGCNIYDYFSTNQISAGIKIAHGNTDWTITNNKFYQTTERNLNNIHSAIQLNFFDINNSLIEGNIIGNSSSLGTGYYELVSNGGGKFYPIYISNHGTEKTTNIQGNFIRNIKLSGYFNGTFDNSPFSAIHVTTGRVDIGNIIGNTIGSSTANGSIQFLNTGVHVDINGIYNNSNFSSKNISNNNIGGITLTGTSQYQMNFYGIRTLNSSWDTITNNTIGFANASINNSSTHNSSTVVGIQSGAAVSLITLNKVSYLNSDAPNGLPGAYSSVVGISNSSSGNISQNLVFGLSNTNTTEEVSVSGIVINSQLNGIFGSTVVEKNNIHSLIITSSNASSSISGIFIVQEGGGGTFQNNFISLGFDISGVSITKNIAINGINCQAYSNYKETIIHNSIYIGGSGILQSSANTYAYKTLSNNGQSSQPNTIQNNIFYNSRSNASGSAKHYTISISGLLAIGPLDMNNNLYYFTGTGGTLGFFWGNTIQSLAAWQNPLTGPGQDANSLFGDPKFISPPNDLHINFSIPTLVEGNGVLISSVLDDYDGENRSGLTPVDIGADAGNFTVNECHPVCLTNSLNISTGFDHNLNSVYPEGSTDAYWELTTSPMNGLQVPRPAGVVRNFGWPDWAEQPGSKWINPFTEAYYPDPLGGGYGNNFPPAEPYVFQTCFCICEDNTQITINLSALADDSAGVYIDDEYIPGSTCSFAQPTQINITKTLNAGMHYIKVKMRNLGGDPLGININGTISGAGILKRECCNTTSTLMGMKFNDLNHNAIRDVGEPGIPNWPIKLNNGTPVLTDAFGFYTFSGLTPGNYTVSEVDASGWTQSFPPTSNYNVTLGSDQVVNNLDFGNFENSSVCDTACLTDSLKINTGFDHNTNSLYPLGSYDEFWKIVSVPSTINVTVPRNAGVLTNLPSPWGTSANSSWLSVDPLNYWQPNTYSEPYVYETKFCVCEDSSIINFDFAIMTDDEGFVYVDNVLQPGQAIGFGGQAFYNFNKTLSQGEHKLQVFVTNSGPTGINVSGNITGANLMKRQCCSSSSCDSAKICAKTVCPTDQFTVCLANSYFPYDIVHSAVGYPDSQGCTYYHFPNANPGESYYIVVRTANSLETWSATPQIVNGSNCLEYDFTTNASKAYGNNMVNINGVWTLYSGDVNQDGVIDLSDLAQIYNGAALFLNGVTDLNCDGITDLTDIIIAYNNATLFAEVKKP